MPQPWSIAFAACPGSHAEVGELDLNPVLARPDGCVAVDACVRLGMRGPRPSSKSW